MAPVSFSHVVRFSSQDTVFKAESLCRGKADASGTWKCAKEDISRGRMEAEFQLERASYIGHIDIGNCGSAFIEILVGNSMWPQDKPFLTLIPSAMLMTPAECKSWTKTHAVRMFSQSAFSKQTIESQWDRIRIICCQPYRKDKQFGLSFIRVASVPEESLQSSLDEDVLQANSPLARKVNDTNDEDGLIRLKKASGLMGCLRNLDKSKSPERPLNRAGKMLQAALDSRSPPTPRHKPRIETSSNPRSPHRKRSTSQSPSEGPTDKRKKSPKQSLAGDIRDELALFLEEIDFAKIDLEQVTFKDLRTQMELQRGCALTKHEKGVFLKMVKAALENSVGGNEVHVIQESHWSTLNKHKDKLKKITIQSCNKLPNSSPEEKAKDKVPSPNTSHASVSLSLVDGAQITEHHPHVKSSDTATDVPSDDELPSMLYSPKKNKPSGTSQKTKNTSTTNQDFLGAPQSKSIKSTSTIPFLVECPICSRFFPRSEVEFHAALCTGLSLNAASSSGASIDNTVPCPVCSKLFPRTEIEQHADTCAESSICKDNGTFAREVISIS